MKLHFDPHQPHQRAAIDAVLEPLRGEPRVTLARAQAGGAEAGVVANQLTLSPHALLRRVQAAQRAAGLPVVERWADPAVPHLSVEMETGTGKTYVYLRTALELARCHGFRKFVVVVPSVAVREGVLKTLRVTADHFAALFPGRRHRFFAYDGARLSRLRSFVRSSAVELMVLTLDAFNKASNRLRREHDGFGGRTPLSLLRATRPVLILDEPQRMDSARSRTALADLDPLLVLRYSATHRHRHALVHRLTPRAAHEQGLVKRIEVLAPAAGVEDRHARISAQLRATIERHLRRQQELRPQGIKVLSLLFVPRVDDWHAADGPVRALFARHFDALKSSYPWFANRAAERVCAAYFAVQRRGGRSRAVDSRTGRSAADEDAYALIMRDKERLLSLDEPVAFVVSHSALREGWDNPNVFQICTMASSRSDIKKRQEVGRGLRLAVDQAGRRVHDVAVNVLTVVANESYEDYVADLQREDVRAVGAEAVAPPPSVAAPSGPNVRASGFASPGPSTTPPWRTVDGARLRLDAIAALDARRSSPDVGVDADADADAIPEPVSAVVELLLRRQPPALVGVETIAAVLEAAGRIVSPGSWRAIELTVDAILAALSRQGLDR